jgi:hypothetical protein
VQVSNLVDWSYESGQTCDCCLLYVRFLLGLYFDPDDGDLSSKMSIVFQPTTWHYIPQYSSRNLNGRAKVFLGMTDLRYSNT